MMISRKLIAALFVLALTEAANADQPSQSNLQIWAETDSLLVLHKHRASASHVAESFVRVIEKQSGYVLSEFDTTPFTEIVPIADGKYFAGLSYFQASSYPHGYNFAVFAPDGRFLIKAFVLHGTDYCEKVSQSVSQYVYWFDRYNPHVEAKLNGSEIIEVLVGDGRFEKPCKFVPGDFSKKISFD